MHNYFCLSAIPDDDDVEELDLADDDDDEEIEEEELAEDDDDEEEDEEFYEEDEHIPLEDDPTDPHYTAQKALIETSIQNRKELAAIKELTFGPGSNERLQTNINEFLDEQLAEAGVDPKTIDDLMAGMSVSEEEALEAMEGANEKMRSDYEEMEEGDRVGIPYD